MISGWPQPARYLAKQLGLKGRVPVSGTPELGTLAPSESAAHPSLSSLGGRGLEIVAYLSDHWGVRADSPGTTVWAVLPALPARV